jgi:hypothetical protein
MQRRTFLFSPTFSADGRTWSTWANVDVEPDPASTGGRVEVALRMRDATAERHHHLRGVIATRTTLRGHRTYQYIPGGSERVREYGWRRTVREAAQDAASHAMGLLSKYGKDRPHAR